MLGDFDAKGTAHTWRRGHVPQQPFFSRTMGRGEDTSRNLLWLGFVHLFQGENWHRNHHQNAKSARLGLETWEIDTGWWAILVLEKLGQARDVKRPRISPGECTALCVRPAESDRSGFLERTGL